jgi:hypothetical protein
MPPCGPCGRSSSPICRDTGPPADVVGRPARATRSMGAMLTQLIYSLCSSHTKDAIAGDDPGPARAFWRLAHGAQHSGRGCSAMCLRGRRSTHRVGAPAGPHRNRRGKSMCEGRNSGPATVRGRRQRLLSERIFIVRAHGEYPYLVAAPYLVDHA